MAIRMFAAVLVFNAMAGYLWWCTFRTLRRREVITKIGADLLRPSQVFQLYRHDVAATRVLERIVQQDRTIPILRDEDRDEAERLIRAFYDDKGE